MTNSAQGASEPSAAKPAANDGLPAYRFSIEEQTPRVGNGGTAREASVAQFPVSKGIAGVSMTLEPGCMRELHWHANAAEWAYVIEGSCRITIYAPDGSVEVSDFGPGDIWYFPRGYGHSIQGIGNVPCHFILVFDNGSFSEFATFSFSDWLAHTPREVLAKNLKLPESTLAKLPTKEVYFAKGPIPPPLAKGGRAPTHRYRLEQQPARKFDGGTLRLATVREFPISTTMSGGIMTLDPGAIRELHWHPNADEWQYLIAGQMRMTVFASSGRAETVEMKPGDVGYAPMGYGHYLENIGQTPLKILLAFNRGDYQDIGISGWIASNPRQLVATNLGLTEAELEKLPKQNVFITE